MATVLWRDQIILLGGKNRVVSDRRWVNETTKNVTRYDTKTGENDMFLAMKHARNGCSAVVTDDVIVVMGGHYNSVEFYDFCTNNWQALKAMKKIRIDATAVVSPL
ncbi:kelch 20 isoform X2 [Paramuricea clavata]|uniref:Kelch 20 isoform X2 n=1 Tax=Paramuricea clavata TaxID=317549 RepID=A0A6S7JX61_PARCT|nr:kelch 20 isoform X2 [Paramuricea clavata]